MLHNITIGLTELKSEWRYNYNVPEIIKLDITSGLPQYLNWVKGSANTLNDI